MPMTLFSTISLSLFSSYTIFPPIPLFPHVIPTSGRLFDGDILEMSESPCFGVGICCTSMGLGWQMGKELDLKLMLGLTEVINWVSTWWGMTHRFESWSDPKLPSLRVWLFLVQLVTVPVVHSTDLLQQRPKRYLRFDQNMLLWVVGRIGYLATYLSPDTDSCLPSRNSISWTPEQETGNSPLSH